MLADLDTKTILANQQYSPDLALLVRNIYTNLASSVRTLIANADLNSAGPLVSHGIDESSAGIVKASLTCSALVGKVLPGGTESELYRQVFDTAASATIALMNSNPEHLVPSSNLVFRAFIELRQSANSDEMLAKLRDEAQRLGLSGRAGAPKGSHGYAQNAVNGICGIIEMCMLSLMSELNEAVESRKSQEEKQVNTIDLVNTTDKAPVQEKPSAPTLEALDLAASPEQIEKAQEKGDEGLSPTLTQRIQTLLRNILETLQQFSNTLSSLVRLPNSQESVSQLSEALRHFLENVRASLRTMLTRVTEALRGTEGPARDDPWPTTEHPLRRTQSLNDISKAHKEDGGVTLQRSASMTAIESANKFLHERGGLSHSSLGDLSEPQTGQAVLTQPGVSQSQSAPGLCHTPPAPTPPKSASSPGLGRGLNIAGISSESLAAASMELKPTAQGTQQPSAPLGKVIDKPQQTPHTTGAKPKMDPEEMQILQSAGQAVRQARATHHAPHHPAPTPSTKPKQFVVTQEALDGALSKLKPTPKSESKAPKHLPGKPTPKELQQAIGGLKATHTDKGTKSHSESSLYTLVTEKSHHAPFEGRKKRSSSDVSSTSTGKPPQPTITKEALQAALSGLKGVQQGQSDKGASSAPGATPGQPDQGQGASR
ncbi:hypothetical protein [Neorickettsia helminthoeca]|nr:hypothetical protein [Neorickettsia helminthoeca]